MAVGTTNISLSAIRTLIGESTWSLFSLGTSELINKWSKYKPIRDAGAGANWPGGEALVGAGHKYGLDISTTSLATTWNYLHPRGGSPGGGTDEPVRLGDFRGYEHSTALAFPTIQAIEGLNPVQNLDPTNGPVSIDWDISSHDDASNVLIRPTDLGLQDYYYGIKISGTNVATMYKTFAQVHDVPDTGTTFSVQATYDINSNSFVDLPLGFGTYNYVLFISSNTTTWNVDHYEWQATAPLNLIELPHEGNFLGHGAFDVSLFIYTSIPDMSWTYNQAGTPAETAVEIGGSGSYEWTYVPDDSLTGWSVFNHTQTDDPVAVMDQGDVGDIIHVYPNDVNASRTVPKTETLQLMLVSNNAITATITLTQGVDDSPLPPVVNYINSTGDPWNITDNGDGYITIGTTTLFYDFYHDESTYVYTYDVTVTDAASNIVYTGTNFVIEPDFPHVTGSFTINRTAVANDVFTLTFSY